MLTTLPTDTNKQWFRISSQVSRADAILHWTAGGGIERVFFPSCSLVAISIWCKYFETHTETKEKKEEGVFPSSGWDDNLQVGSQVGEFELDLSVQLVLASLMRKLQRRHPRKLLNQWIQSLLNHKSISQFAHLLCSALIKNYFNQANIITRHPPNPKFWALLWFDTPKCEFKKRWWNHS